MEGSDIESPGEDEDEDKDDIDFQKNVSESSPEEDNKDDEPVGSVLNSEDSSTVAVHSKELIHPRRQARSFGRIKILIHLTLHGCMIHPKLRLLVQLMIRHLCNCSESILLKISTSCWLMKRVPQEERKRIKNYIRIEAWAYASKWVTYNTQG